MKSKAFTIIELMIVVAIIAFLATISVPKYFNYYAKAKQSEVVVNLASLHTAQTAYWAEHGEYTTDMQKLGWKPSNGHYYTYGFNVSGAQEGVNFFTGKLQAPKKALGQTYTGKEGFVAKAVADISGKNKMDVWQIDQDRKLENIEKGLE
jgi:prepilin-type N-terminal cleavage/methylation domain-containing protein